VETEGVVVMAGRKCIMFALGAEAQGLVRFNRPTPLMDALVDLYLLLCDDSDVTPDGVRSILNARDRVTALVTMKSDTDAPNLHGADAEKEADRPDASPVEGELPHLDASVVDSMPRTVSTDADVTGDVGAQCQGTVPMPGGGYDD
jgi:hypothetical protein